MWCVPNLENGAKGSGSLLSLREAEAIVFILLVLNLFVQMVRLLIGDSKFDKFLLSYRSSYFRKISKYSRNNDLLFEVADKAKSVLIRGLNNDMPVGVTEDEAEALLLAYKYFDRMMYQLCDDGLLTSSQVEKILNLAVDEAVKY